MPNYNHAAYLPEAPDAILSQGHRPLVTVVLGDASPDGSMAILEAYARRESLLRVERNPVNLGVVRTLERLFEMARGEYVFAPAADDRVLPGSFEAVMDLLARHPGVGLCCGLSRVMDEEGTDLGLFPSSVVSDEPTYFPPARVRELLPRGLNG